jgi:sugar phosphate permease
LNARSAADRRVTCLIRLRKLKSSIFAVTWLTYAGFYLCRKNLSITLPLLHQTTSLTNLQLANIVFGYSLLYAIGQFACGLLSDCFGPKRVVGTGLGIIVASNVLMPFHPSAAWLLACACFNGAGQSTGWSGLVKTMDSWVSRRQRGIVMAWWSTNYVLGGFLATAFATWAVTEHMLFPNLGWARGFLFPAALLGTIALLFFLLVSNVPADDSASRTLVAAADSGASGWSKPADLIRLVFSKSIWSIGSSYFFLEACRYALLFWLPFYMVNELHFTLKHSGYISSLYELMGVTGAVTAGYVSDRLMGSRRAPVSIMMLCGFALVMLLQMHFSRPGLAGMAIVVSLAGIFTYGPDTLLSGAAAQDVGQTKATATASGLIDGIGHLGSLLSPYLVVFISAHYGWDKLFLVFAVAGMMAALMLLPVWNLRPVETHLDFETAEEMMASMVNEEAG